VPWRFSDADRARVGRARHLGVRETCTLRDIAKSNPSKSSAEVFSSAQISRCQRTTDQVRGQAQLASKSIKAVGVLSSRYINAAPQHAVLSRKD
jgi:hypothetical protein